VPPARSPHLAPAQPLPLTSRLDTPIRQRDTGVTQTGMPARVGYRR